MHRAISGSGVLPNTCGDYAYKVLLGLAASPYPQSMLLVGTPLQATATPITSSLSLFSDPNYDGTSYIGTTKFTSTTTTTVPASSTTTSRKDPYLCGAPFCYKLKSRGNVKGPERPPREMHLYAYSDCSSKRRCDTGFAVADLYAFSPEKVCESGDKEIGFYSVDAKEPNVRFKSYGHEGCRIDPDADLATKEEMHPGSFYGQLDCGQGLTGKCTIPSEADAQARRCDVDDHRHSAVKDGTVLKMMAICKFGKPESKIDRSR